MTDDEIYEARKSLIKEMDAVGCFLDIIRDIQHQMDKADKVLAAMSAEFDSEPLTLYLRMRELEPKLYTKVRYLTNQFNTLPKPTREPDFDEY